jgi:putrescine transport system ATP-binding protein
VRLDAVTKRFGDFTAVRELTLDIERGEFFTLLGPSGCGKTTTLRMVAGFEEPSEGRVLLDGADVTGLPAFKRSMSSSGSVSRARQSASRASSPGGSSSASRWRARS